MKKKPSIQYRKLNSLFAFHNPEKTHVTHKYHNQTHTHTHKHTAYIRKHQRLRRHDDRALTGYKIRWIFDLLPFYASRLKNTTHHDSSIAQREHSRSKHINTRTHSKLYTLETDFMHLVKTKTISKTMMVVAVLVFSAVVSLTNKVAL